MSKITQLNSGDTLTGSEHFVIEQNGELRKLPLTYIDSYFSTHVGSTIDTHIDSSEAYLNEQYYMGVGIFQAQHIETSGAASGDATAGDDVRPINTLVLNSITSASLNVDSYQVTLPPGYYRIDIKASSFRTGRTRIRLWNTVDSASALLGHNNLMAQGRTHAHTAELDGYLQVDSLVVFEIWQNSQHSKSSNGFGVVMNDGHDEVYLNMFVEKIL